MQWSTEHFFLKKRNKEDLYELIWNEFLTMYTDK